MKAIALGGLIILLFIAELFSYIEIRSHGHAKVLHHYLFKDFNLKKIECACFLIDNMCYHHVTGIDDNISAIRKNLKNRTDSIYNFYKKKYGWELIPIKKILEERKKSQIWIENNFKDKIGYRKREQFFSYDEFLIRQIDEAFELWHNSPFAKEISFKEFEESMLPYCCIPAYGRLQSPKQLQALMPVLKGLDKETDLKSIVHRYHKTISDLRDINGTMGEKAAKGIMSLYSRDEDCLDIAHYGCMLLRAYGVPTVVYHVVGFRQLPDRHYFCCLYNTEKKEWQGFNAEGSLPGDSDFLGTPTLNIYRDTYAAQKETPYFLRNKNEYVPGYLNQPCMKDVSELYMPVCKVTLPFHNKTDNRLAYLATFSSNAEEGLLATTWGVIDKKSNEVTFNKALLDVLYFPVYYKGNHAASFGKPFYLHKDKGQISRHYLPINGNGQDKSAMLLRKYPLKQSMQEQAEKMIGTVFLGSNGSTFAKADTLLVLKTAPTQYLEEYRFSRTGNYKYYRLQPPKDYPHSTISHLEWLAKRSGYNDVLPSTRTAITSPRQRGKVTTDACFVKMRDAKIKEMEKQPQYDGNPLTSAGGRKNITLTLKSPQRVEAVRLMAVHENNVINAGDQYQLYFWDGSEWTLCGEQTAEYEYLLFNNIPANRLYWLRDITEGQEELPFFLTSYGQQRFIYPDIIK